MQKNIGDVTLKTNNYLDVLPKIPRYCCQVEIFCFNFIVLKKYD